MRSRWSNISEYDQGLFRTSFAFLRGRLEKRETIDWALRLGSKDTILRKVLLNLLDGPDGDNIRDPWRTAWRLIEESWETSVVEGHGFVDTNFIQKRLRSGDRSGSLITEIVELVAPRLEIGPFKHLDLFVRKPQRSPKKVEDLFSTSLTSGEIAEPSMLGLDSLTDQSFLVSLAFVLDASVVNGLEIAKRIRPGEEISTWRLGGLHRVYYVPTTERENGTHEPDEFLTGIAPSVKLLYAVVSRLIEISISRGVEFVHRWRFHDSIVHLRLWAAISRDPRVTPASEVGIWLLSLSDQIFWDCLDFPEIAELRAKRFSEFDPSQQVALLARIRKLPPRNMWPRKADTKKIKKQRLQYAARELRRIEISGSTLPQKNKAWLATKIAEFPNIAQMVRLDEGFPDCPSAAHWIPPNPDGRYTLLAGEKRLQTLEASLTPAPDKLSDDSAERAADWIRKQENHVHVLADLESTANGGASFARVWERFGWGHSPTSKTTGNSAQSDETGECARVLSLLAKLPVPTLRNAIGGISHWLSTWEKQVVVLPDWLNIWFKLWPIAVEATNEKQPHDVQPNLDASLLSLNSSEPVSLDTLNNPTGKLIGVFLKACPKVKPNDRPFETSGPLRMMRKAVMSVTGHSYLIAQYLMIESLRYFHTADPDWTLEYLIKPLSTDDTEASTLWNAIGREIQGYEILQIIGDLMVGRASDQRLHRSTRRSLVFSLIIECLQSYREKRKPAVSSDLIQQMIRSLDEEVRVFGARTVQRFVLDVSSSTSGDTSPPSPEELFRSAVLPFLQEVWPQERSLATPGISKAFAVLPATTQEEFSNAVNAIELFLVPFECWSMHEYGLFDANETRWELSNIDDVKKANAFLTLLDLTIGTTEGVIIPYDLADALAQIRKKAPKLAATVAFRRLATAARRE